MPKNNCTLVVNLKARQSTQLIHDMEDYFKDSGLNLTKIHKVKDPKQLKAYIKRAISEKPNILVLGGGDGTLIGGIENALKLGFKGNFGIIPLGTANYLARDLGIPLQTKQAIAQIKQGSPRAIPLGVAGDKFFALMLTIGLTEKISSHVSDKTKRRLGQLAYITEAFKHTRRKNTFNYTVETPALKSPLRGKSHQIVVYNADLNQQLKIAPDHKLHKPTLKVVIYQSGPRVGKLFVSLLVHILSVGKLKPYMKVIETDQLTINTAPKRKVGFDGEVLSTTPAKISVQKQAAKIIC